MLTFHWSLSIIDDISIPIKCLFHILISIRFKWRFQLSENLLFSIFETTPICKHVEYTTFHKHIDIPAWAFGTEWPVHIDSIFANILRSIWPTLIFVIQFIKINCKESLSIKGVSCNFTIACANRVLLG